MLNIKTLTTAAATAALIGSLGLAYAQTTNDPSTTNQVPGVSQTQPNAQAQQAPTGNSSSNMPAGTTPSGTTSSTTTQSGTMQPGTTPSANTQAPMSGSSTSPADTSTMGSAMNDRAPQADRN